MTIREHLFSLQDEIYRKREDYRYFQARVLAVNPESIIGVRTPVLRKYAREIFGTQDAAEFMTDLPHHYHEEKQLHGFLIGLDKDFDKAVAELDRFLPYVDSWATTDSISPKIFARRTDSLLPHIDRWLASGHTYTIRFAILCLMNYYLSDKTFSPEYLEKAAAFAGSEEYYIRMMVAWYFATALAKQWDAAIKILENRKMPKWTHNKTIRKAVESFRITPEQKTLLRALAKNC